MNKAFSERCGLETFCNHGIKSVVDNVDKIVLQVIYISGKQQLKNSAPLVPASSFCFSFSRGGNLAVQNKNGAQLYSFLARMISNFETGFLHFQRSFLLTNLSHIIFLQNFFRKIQVIHRAFTARIIQYNRFTNTWCLAQF